jgi:protein-S-isoprenylcysteine O-methyltransferase Ste14
MSQLAERLRKKVSRIAAVFWFVGAGATVPALGEDSISGRTLYAVGAILAIIGSTGRTWCLVPIAGRKDKQLMTDGPYSICRNPLYLFSLIGAVGVGLATRTVTVPGVAFAAFLIYYVGVIRSEQNRLAETHGDAFKAYVAEVNALFPSLRTYRPLGETQEVYVRPFLKGLVDNGWFIVAFVGLQVIGEMRDQGMFFRWLTLP